MTYQVPLSAVEIAKLEAERLAKETSLATPVIEEVVTPEVEVEAPVVEETPADTSIDPSVANKLTGFFNNILKK